MLLLAAAVSLILQQPDSGALRRAARSAQEGFERFRVTHVPRTFDGTGYDCDEVVGRFCFWHDDDDQEDSPRPPPEPPEIVAARRALIGRLDSVARLIPGDPWVVGQRVRYLAEAGDSSGALEAAGACRADSWWCLALTGYARHTARAFVAADSAFAAALSHMPLEERCRWTDLSLLMERLPHSYGETSCADRAEVERLVWWLADPLYLVPGNERRTEHFARHVLNRMQNGARSGYGVRWGNDLRELLIRYGWPIAFARNQRPGSYDATGMSMTAYHEPASRRFLPESDLTIGELRPHRPRSSYAPPYAASLEEMETQIALFRRGDSTVVVAGYDLGSARRFPSGDEVRIEAALVALRDPHAAPIVARADPVGRQGALALIVPAHPGLISVEALARGDSVRGYRARVQPVTPPGGFAISDPLLLGVTDEDSLPLTLEDAIPHARGNTRLTVGERLGLFWEMYGLHGPAGATVSLRVMRIGAGFLRRAAEWAGITGRYRPSVSLSWIEPPVATLVHPRALVITLPETNPGRYVLEITVRSGDGDSATTRRALSIETVRSER